MATNKNATDNSQNTPTKYLDVLPDDRLLVTWKLESKWSGEIYLGDDGKSIKQETVYTKDKYFKANTLMGNTGLTSSNDVFLVNQQAERNHTFVRFGGGKTNGVDEVTKKETVFNLPFEVDPHIYNFVGNVQGTITVSAYPTGDWVSIVLRKKGTAKPASRPIIRRRGVRENCGAGTTRARPEDTETTALLQEAHERLGETDRPAEKLAKRRATHVVSPHVVSPIAHT
jgi:hypothetical protein